MAAERAMGSMMGEARAAATGFSLVIIAFFVSATAALFAFAGFMIQRTRVLAPNLRPGGQ
jgi:hypothetical protein